MLHKIKDTLVLHPHLFSLAQLGESLLDGTGFLHQGIRHFVFDKKVLMAGWQVRYGGGLEGLPHPGIFVSSGWDHAFASLPVSHGSTVVVGSGCLFGFFLPALLGGFSGLSVAPGTACHCCRILRPVPARVIPNQ